MVMANARAKLFRDVDGQRFERSWIRVAIHLCRAVEALGELDEHGEERLVRAEQLRNRLLAEVQRLELSPPESAVFEELRFEAGGLPELDSLTPADVLEA